MEDEEAPGPVHHHRVAGVDGGVDRTKADHRGDGQGAGHEGGVRGAPADVGREPDHLAPVHEGGIRGGDVVGDHHHLLGQGGQVLALASGQVVQDPAGDVADVGHALLDVVVLHLAEGGGVFPDHLLEDVLGVDPLGLDPPHHLFDQGPVLDHQEVGVEERGLLPVQALGQLAPDLHQLLAGGDQGVLEAGDLGRDLLLPDGPGGDGRLLDVEEMGLAHHDAGGGGDALENELLVHKRQSVETNSRWVRVRRWVWYMG